MAVTGGATGTFSGSGSSYTLVVTPAGTGDVTVEVAANAAEDGAGNTGPASAVSATAAWDTTAPAPDIVVPSGINSTAAFTASFEFSEAVTGFDASDVTVTGGAKGTFSGSGSSYALVVTPAGTADVTVTVAANAAEDGAGNTGPASAVSATAAWDTTAPTVDIRGVPSWISSTADFTASFEFSEAVTGFDASDVTVTGGAKGAFAGSGSSYTLVVTPDGSDSVTVTVAANAAADGANNAGPPSVVSVTAVWDGTAPTVQIGGVPSGINSTADFTASFEFSEAVTGFETADVMVTGGTKGAFAGSGSSYTLVVTPVGSVDVTVEVAANAAVDGANNAGPASVVSVTAAWDTTAPTLDIGVPSEVGSADFTASFTFSEVVTGFDADDVMVTGGTKGTFEGSGLSYTLVVTPVGTDDVTVAVAANAAVDGANNAGPASAESATALRDTTAPTVHIVVPSGINSTADFTASFEFSEAVTGFETADVAVTGGTKGTFSGSGSRYTLVVTPDGSDSVTVEVAANAAEDDANNAGPASAESATAVWDTTAPTVADIGGMPSWINSTADLTASFEFSEAVTGFDAEDVTVTGGAKGAFAGSGSSYTLVVTPDGSVDVTVTVAAERGGGRREQRGPGVGGERDGGVGRHRSDGAYRRRAVRDQLDGRLHGEFRVFGGGDGVRDGRRDGDGWHEGRV